MCLQTCLFSTCFIGMITSWLNACAVEYHNINQLQEQANENALLPPYQKTYRVFYRDVGDLTNFTQAIALKSYITLLNKYLFNFAVSSLASSFKII